MQGMYYIISLAYSCSELRLERALVCMYLCPLDDLLLSQRRGETRVEVRNCNFKGNLGWDPVLACEEHCRVVFNYPKRLNTWFD